MCIKVTIKYSWNALVAVVGTGVTNLRDQLATRDLPVLRPGDGFVKIKLKVTPELPALMIRHSRHFRLH